MLFGLAHQSLLIFDLFDRSLTNANMVVIATSGAGKSFCLKLLVLRQLAEGVGSFIIDPDDEYRRLCAAVGGQYIRLALASRQAINPLDLPLPSTQDDDEPRDPVAEQVASVLTLLELLLADPGRQLAAAERALLDRALYATYAASGITPADPTSWSRPAPLLGDLAAELTAQPGDLAASLVVRLERYVSGSLAGLVNRRTNVSLDGRLVVFSIQQLEKDLQPLAIQIITAYIWGRIRRDRQPRLLVVDEAWKLLQHPAGADFLQAMYRRARKYELGVVALTHRAEDFLATDHGAAILANTAVKLLLKQTETSVRTVAQLFALTSGEERDLLGARKGEGLFFARGSRVALTVVACPEEHDLATSDPREVAALEAAAHTEAASAALPSGTSVSFRPEGRQR
ncbi:MAG TPA: DUF87 domain-containing protein [Nitrolancea sp.]|nr:DUF87 domain-containing protein [Nitrolancea sp.]